MAANTLSINRAPVLTLWGAVVAERLGFNQAEALTLGRALAGLNAQAKGRRLGIYKPHEEKVAKARAKALDEVFRIEICGRPIPAMNTEEGIRAVQGRKAINPDRVESYLEGKFGEYLIAVRQAMKKLAKTYKPKELANVSFSLYEQFRPQIPAGKRGWGAQGELDLKLLEKMASARNGSD
jgi:hypothetical protein